MKIDKEEDEKLIPSAKLTAESPDGDSINLKADDSNQLKQNDDHSSSIKDPVNGNKAKSCKGCLYYSSRLRSDSRNPLCVGITRSLPSVPQYMVGQSEMEASKEGRSLKDFRYACVGYSLYTNQKEQASGGQETQTELPVCVGFEVLADRRVSVPDVSPAPSHIQNREDGTGLPQRRSPKPTNSAGEEFLGRFSRNATLVANGVAKNIRRVGNEIKQSVNDILYPYRGRPK